MIDLGIRAMGGRRRLRSFALVLTLYLVVLLATTGAGLAFTASVETVLAGRTADELDHRLAIDSVLTCLPALLVEPSSRPAAPGSSPAAVRRVEARFGGCRVVADVRREREKLYPRAGESAESLGSRLRELARRNGLPEEGVAVRPVVSRPDGPRLRALLWFDQVVKTTELEEVFRWRLEPLSLPPWQGLGPGFRRGDGLEEPGSLPPWQGGNPLRGGDAPAKKTWSELVSFWSGGSGEALSVDLQTSIENDVRRWYVVVAVQDSRVRVLHWGPVP